MCKEIVSTEPGKAIIRECEDGLPGSHDVKVRVQYAAAKHGTEFAMFRDISAFSENTFDEKLNMFIKCEDVNKVPYFMTPGNMWVGIITEIGVEVKNHQVGDQVAGYGGFRTVQIANENEVLKMENKMSWQAAMCYDPAQFALGGIRDGQIRLGDNVVIFGLGAIGLIAAQMARLAGARKIIVCDPIEIRREIALNYGADFAIDSTATDAGLEIKKMTAGRGADVTIETSGSYQALQQAIRGAAYNANVAVVGWYKECHGGLDFGMEAHFNQPNIFFSRACSEPNRDYPRWSFDRINETCWELLSAGKINCEKIINPVVAFKDAAQKYMDIEQNAVNSIKLGIDYSL
ncbi:MAG: zinc-binding alcohol dehydrogenase [Spirochaetales bacterium]